MNIYMFDNDFTGVGLKLEQKNVGGVMVQNVYTVKAPFAGVFTVTFGNDDPEVAATLGIAITGSIDDRTFFKMPREMQRWMEKPAIVSALYCVYVWSKNNANDNLADPIGFTEEDVMAEIDRRAAKLMRTPLVTYKHHMLQWLTAVCKHHGDSRQLAEIMADLRKLYSYRFGG